MKTIKKASVMKKPSKNYLKQDVASAATIGTAGARKYSKKKLPKTVDKPKNLVPKMKKK